MKLIAIADIPPTPWKNGGGVTREIAVRADEKGFIWRLSVADVGRNGPFSMFPGLLRILTVIAGDGLRLRHAGGVLEANRGNPVSFDGDTPIDCELVSGPVRDFNLIYDPKRAAMSVERLEAGTHRVLRGRPLGLLPVGAPCEASGAVVPAGSFLLFGETNAASTISVETGGVAVLLSVDGYSGG
ncbi:MAG: HutD family protein [Parvularculaceae bacterium]